MIIQPNHYHHHYHHHHHHHHDDHNDEVQNPMPTQDQETHDGDILACRAAGENAYSSWALIPTISVRAEVGISIRSEALRCKFILCDSQTDCSWYKLQHSTAASATASLVMLDTWRFVLKHVRVGQYTHVSIQQSFTISSQLLLTPFSFIIILHSWWLSLSLQPIALTTVSPEQLRN